MTCKLVTLETSPFSLLDDSPELLLALVGGHTHSLTSYVGNEWSPRLNSGDASGTSHRPQSYSSWKLLHEIVKMGRHSACLRILLFWLSWYWESGGQFHPCWDFILSPEAKMQLQVSVSDLQGQEMGHKRHNIPFGAQICSKSSEWLISLPGLSFPTFWKLLCSYLKYFYFGMSNVIHLGYTVFGHHRRAWFNIGQRTLVWITRRAIGRMPIYRVVCEWRGTVPSMWQWFTAYWGFLKILLLPRKGMEFIRLLAPFMDT